MAITVSVLQKDFLIQRVYPKQRIKMFQIFTLTYHLTFPTGCACLFMGFANRSQAKCTLPHPSPIPIPPSTNLPMLGLGLSLLNTLLAVRPKIVF
jgi:hypothetical protein